MKYVLISIALFPFVCFSQIIEPAKTLAQNTETAVKSIADTTKSGWKRAGNISFLFNQSSFSHWTSGGANNLSLNVGVNYDLNYKRNNLNWDNKIIASYGLVKSNNVNFEQKTDDRIELNSVLGQKAFGNWYYSMFLNFKTQFYKGYIYEKDSNGLEIRTENTNFFSPAYFTFGPGMYWKKSNNFNINLAPLTSRFTFVNPHYTSILGYVNGSYFGVNANDKYLYQLGFYASGYYKLNLMTNVSVENIINLYSDYLKNPKNIVLNYSLIIVMKINKALSTNFNFQTIYDDNAYSGFQSREVLGLAINYKF